MFRFIRRTLSTSHRTKATKNGSTLLLRKFISFDVRKQPRNERAQNISGNDQLRRLMYCTVVISLVPVEVALVVQAQRLQLIIKFDRWHIPRRLRTKRLDFLLRKRIILLSLKIEKSTESTRLSSFTESAENHFQVVVSL